MSKQVESTETREWTPKSWSRKEAWQIIFWSFELSQGDRTMQREIFGWVRYTFPDRYFDRSQMNELLEQAASHARRGGVRGKHVKVSEQEQEREKGSLFEVFTEEDLYTPAMSQSKRVANFPQYCVASLQAIAHQLILRDAAICLEEQGLYAWAPNISEARSNNPVSYTCKYVLSTGAEPDRAGWVMGKLLGQLNFYLTEALKPDSSVSLPKKDLQRVKSLVDWQKKQDAKFKSKK